MSDEWREGTLSTADFVAGANRKMEDSQNLDIGGDIPGHNGAGMARSAGAAMAEDRSAPLFGTEEGQHFRARWTEIQTAFVDEPRKAVEQADGLVAEAIKRLAEIFANERAKLEHEWDRGGDNVSTEDLRQALRRYRSFFDRLLSV